MGGELAPVGHQQFFDSSGNPLGAGTLVTSESGGATPLATYADPLLSTTNGTTITLNGAGRPSVTGSEVALFLDPSKAYRFTLKDSSGSTIWTCDNIGSNVSGTYTPTLTNTTNVATSTPFANIYIRVGNIVTVYWTVDIDPTAAGSTLTEFGMSLPIASNFSDTVQLTGVGNCGRVPAQASSCGSDSANDRASIVFYATDTGGATHRGAFAYRII